MSHYGFSSDQIPSMEVIEEAVVYLKTLSFDENDARNLHPTVLSSIGSLVMDSKNQLKQIHELHSKLNEADYHIGRLRTQRNALRHQLLSINQTINGGTGVDRTNPILKAIRAKEARSEAEES